MTVMFYFCGGCNQRHDRALFAERLRLRYPQIRFVLPSWEGECDAVVVICGCNAACANHEHATGKAGKIIVRGAEDFPAVCAFLEALPAD